MQGKWTFGVIFSAILLLGSASFNTANSSERLWRLGWLDQSQTPATPDGSPNLRAFRQGMRDLGYIETRDFVIEPRLFSDTDRSRLPGLAKELVDADVDIIVTVGTPTTVEAARATSTIPIVMTGSNDPIARGLITSFAHPGGNVTGVTHRPGGEFWLKGVQLLKDAVPGINRIAVLYADANQPRPVSIPGLVLRAYEIGNVQNPEDLDVILSQVLEYHADALFLFPEFVVAKFGNKIGEFIRANNLPTMSEDQGLIERGALLYYYTDFLELRRRAATYVDKIIKGAKPGDLPVEQPSKFNFIVNLKAAQELGLTIPQSILSFADQVME